MKRSRTCRDDTGALAFGCPELTVDPSGELGFSPADLYHEVDKRTGGGMAPPQALQRIARPPLVIAIAYGTEYAYA